MSDADAPPREWRCYVRDMIGFCEKVRTYTQGMTQEEFVADDLVHDATLRNLELIGEAALCIPRAVRDAHPEIPWHRIIGMRNRIAHAYLGIDDDIVWSVVEGRVPALIPALQALLVAAGEGV